MRVPDAFVFHAAHGHFHFPLAAFGLYTVAADGGIGAPVAVSPKNGFCIDDSYIYDSTVVHAGAFVGTKGSCADPTTLRGLTVGAADEYDYRDPGQAIPFDGVADGTYWFRAVSDPNNDFAEANEANNETDVKVTIAGNTVTAGQVLHPDTTPPRDLVGRAGRRHARARQRDPVREQHGRRRRRRPVPGRRQRRRLGRARAPTR